MGRGIEGSELGWVEPPAGSRRLLFYFFFFFTFFWVAIIVDRDGRFPCGVFCQSERLPRLHLLFRIHCAWTRAVVRFQQMCTYI
jgi:hypothetical protein